MKTEKRLLAVFAAAAGGVILFLIWLSLNFAGEVPRENFRRTQPLAMEVVYEDGEETLSAQLTDVFSICQTLMFKTTHTKVEVRIDEEVIYRFGWEKGMPGFMKSPGTMWHFVTLPGESSGKNLEIQLTAVYDNFYGNEGEIYYGTRGDCVLERLTDSLPILMIDCLIMITGVICIFLYIATYSRRQEGSQESFLCAGFFAMAIAVWSLCQSGLLQFVIPNGEVLYFVDFFSFYLFPVPFNIFVASISKTKYRKGFLYLAGAYLVNLAAALAVQLLGWRDLFELMPITHMLMAANVFYVFFAVSKEVRTGNNETASQFRIPLYIVMIFAGAELVSYYMKGFRETSIFIPLGAVSFILMLIWIQVVRYYRVKMEEQKVAYYEKLANTDSLTGAMSRNAYEQALRQLEREEDPGRIDMVTLDVNGMKYINDHYGHEKGDEALKLCYDCVCRAFGNRGRCFRTGGDEFVFLSGRGEDLQERLQLFRELVGEAAKQVDYPFQVALGYAGYEPESGESVRAALRRSDAQMYVNKRELQIPVPDEYE